MVGRFNAVLTTSDQDRERKKRVTENKTADAGVCGGSFVVNMACSATFIGDRQVVRPVWLPYTAMRHLARRV